MMEFLVMLLVGVATMVLAISAATGILHVLLQLMDASSLPQRATAGDSAAGGSAELPFRP